MKSWVREVMMLWINQSLESGGPGFETSFIQMFFISRVQGVWMEPDTSNKKSAEYKFSRCLCKIERCQ